MYGYHKVFVVASDKFLRVGHLVWQTDLQFSAHQTLDEKAAQVLIDPVGTVNRILQLVAKVIVDQLQIILRRIEWLGGRKIG